jgi:MFS family permease
LLVGFPDHWKPSWKFLTEREVRWVIDVVNKDRGDAAAEPFAIGKFLRPALDWKIWIYALVFFNTTTMSYALAFFLPSILLGMGYTHFMSQIMGAPPYVFAGFVMYFCGWAGDKWRIRGPLIIMNMVLCVSGLCLMGYTPPKSYGVKLFGIFLVAAGANANIPVVMTYQVSRISRSGYLMSIKH